MSKLVFIDKFGLMTTAAYALLREQNHELYFMKGLSKRADFDLSEQNIIEDMDIASLNADCIFELRPLSKYSLETANENSSPSKLEINSIYLYMPELREAAPPLSDKKFNTCVGNLKNAFFDALKPTLNATKLASEINIILNSKHRFSRYYIVKNKDENLIYKGIVKFIDYGFSLAFLWFFWWVLLIIWLWVKLDSSGSGIFSQSRIGRDGKAFVCYKFRTMAKGTKQAATHEINQSTVTKAGSFLRKFKLDELPQIFNILKGEMSLVGPRPGLVIQEQLKEERQKRGVLEVIPGITGFAQVNGVDMSDPIRLAEVDRYALATRSIPQMFKILIRTVFGGGRGDRTRSS